MVRKILASATHSWRDRLKLRRPVVVFSPRMVGPRAVVYCRRAR